MPTTQPDVWLSRQSFEKTVAAGDRAKGIPRFVREAVERALRIEAFYRENNHKADDMILPKTMPEILHQMGKGTVFTCEIRAGFDRHIIAASILWEKKMLTIDPHGDLAMGDYYEAGTQQSIVPGYNFQWILNAFTLLAALSRDPGPTFFTATFGDNEASKKNFRDRMHFADWSPLPETWKCERESALKSIRQSARGVCWFRPTLRTLVAAAQLVVDLTQNPIKQRSRSRSETASAMPGFPDAEAIKFHCEEKLLNWIRPEVDAVATRQPTTFDQLCDVLGYEISPGFLQI
jgi:hypothetical protein